MIKLNGKDRPDCTSIDALLMQCQYEYTRIAVLVNGEIVKREKWGKFELKSGDEIEVVSFVGGG